MQDILSFYSSWQEKPSLEDKGFVVASDLTQEWLLPWWWDHYSKHNDFPVTFVDFGLSTEMKQWCKQKGNYVQLPISDLFVAEKESFSATHIGKWEKEYGKHFWNSRGAWFKKPLACLQSPYKTSVWMDLDCEIRGNLKDLFCLPLPPSQVLISKEYGHEGVNSGVIIFKQKAPLIQDWAKNSLENNHLFVGDQDILYSVIKEKNLCVGELSHLYNWSRINPENPDALVLHWHGQYGKAIIEHQIIKMQLADAGFF